MGLFISRMSDATVERVLRRDLLIVIAAVAMLTVLAWGYTVWLVTHMDMSDMPDEASSMTQMSMETMLAPNFQAWSATHFFFLVAMWSVMMVGMMTPSVAPMILLYARVGRQAASKGEPLASTGIFAGGYLLAWLLFSLFAAAGQTMLERAALLTPMMSIASRSLGGLVLIAAGLFQWTPLKDACLQNCQSPLAFIQRYGGFQRNSLRSIGLGFRHGLYCVGCCWALMAVLFVGGVMLTRIAGIGFIAWGTLLLGRAIT
jgi:predicted metal-binding membrane protein